MTKEELIRLKQDIAALSEEDKKERDLYLRGLANGDIQGPPVGYPSIDKPWLKYYSEKDLKLTVPEMSICDFMRKNTEDYDDLDAFEYFGFKTTFKEFKKQIEDVKKSISTYGIKKGEIVSVCLPNIPEVGYIFYALNDMGVVVNLLDPRTNPSTLVKSVDDAKSKLVITLDLVAEAFTGSKADNIVSVSSLNSMPKPLQKVIKILDKSVCAEKVDDKRVIDYSEFMKKGRGLPNVSSAKFEKGVPAVIAYTGGTTGLPKGVLMTNEAFNAMVVENSVAGFNFSRGDTTLGMAPPWTYYGISNSFNAYLCLGATTKLIPKFGPDDLGKIVLKNKPNHIVSVPSALVGLMNEKKLSKADLNFIKTVIVGADKLSIKLEEEFNEFLRKHNSTAKVSKGYGMTEVCAAATYTAKDSNIPGSVGIPFLFEDVTVFNPDDSFEELGTGERGEVCIKGPKNMLGYFGFAEEQSSSVLKEHSDGTAWIHTGDLGHLDEDGKLFIDGRLKRMFVKAGFKIFPGEIETHMLKHPDVEQAAVVATEDESNGFITSAFVVLAEGCEKDNKEIQEELDTILRTNLYDYEIPDSIEVIDKMPLTQMQKVDFKALEDRANKRQEKVKKLKA